MDTSDDSNDAWLGDGDGHDFDDPDFEDEDTKTFINSEDTWQYVLRLQEVEGFQENDRTCYLIWYENERIGSKAEMIYPTDSVQHVSFLLRRLEPSQLEDMVVTNKWPKVNVHRMGRYVPHPPDIVHHFCNSRRARLIECLNDIIDTANEIPDLKYRIGDIAQGMLMRYQKAEAMIGKVHVLVIDLLQQGGSFAYLAGSFLNTGETEYYGTFTKEFSRQEVGEAIETGTCKENARYFFNNTKIRASDVKDLKGLQLAIKKEHIDIHDQLYKNYLGSLRFNTSQDVISNVVIPLYERSFGSLRQSVGSTLIRIGYRQYTENDTPEWKRLEKETIS